MIKVGLPSALIYGSSKPESDQKILSNLYWEEGLQEDVIAYFRDNANNFTKHLAELSPDIIITIGGTRASWHSVVLNASDLVVASKWVHYTKEYDDETLGRDIARYATNWACDTYPNVYGNKDFPYFSVFTGAYKTDIDRIYRSYHSMLNQTYSSWEWVVVDDSPEDHNETWQILQELAKKDHRVKPHRIFPISGGNIGEVKNRAASLANGTWLVEMDHDDALAPTLFEDCVKASKQYPDAGFIYTNCAEPFEDGEMRKYTNTIGDKKDWYANPNNTFVWGYGGHRKTEIEDTEYIEHIYPNINPKTIRFNIGMPNHARIWRKDVYTAIGRHNKFVSVADDYELIVRTFLNTKMLHINKLLYFQYNNRNSTVDNNRNDINRKSRLIKDYYDKQIHERFIELGVEDWEWNDNDDRANLFQNDMDRLKYFDKENFVNYIYNE